MLGEGLRAQLDEAIDENDLGRLRKQIHEGAAPCIVLYERPAMTLGDIYEEYRKDVNPKAPRKFPEGDWGFSDEWEAHVEKSFPIGNSHVGGMPDLPPEVAWPRVNRKKLPLIAQVDLAALPKVAGIDLPQSGWLYAFAGGEDFPMLCTLEHFEGDRRQLHRAQRPDQNDMLVDWRGKGIYKLVPIIKAREGISFPYSYQSKWWESLRLKDDEEEALQSLAESLCPPEHPEGGNEAARLFGYVAAEDAEPPSTVVKHGGLGGDDWLLLLEVGSNGSMSWSDEGRLNFFVRDGDLKKRSWARPYVTIMGGG